LLRIAIVLSGNIRLDPVAELSEEGLTLATHRDEEAAQELGT
jgi:hypothetical protein